MVSLALTCWRARFGGACKRLLVKCCCMYALHGDRSFTNGPRLLVYKNPMQVFRKQLKYSFTGRLKPFGCRLAAVRRSAWGSPASAAAEALLDERGEWPELPRLAATADIIVLACVQVLISGLPDLQHAIHLHELFVECNRSCRQQDGS